MQLVNTVCIYLLNNISALDAGMVQQDEVVGSLLRKKWSRK